MKSVLVDSRWNGGGIKRFADELLARIQSRFSLQFTPGGYPISDPLSPLRLSREIRAVQPDVFWSPGFVPPAFSPTPFVFTIHDLIHVRASGALRATYYNLVIRPLARRAVNIITVSDFSRRDICSWTGLDEDRVTVVPNAVSGDFSPAGVRFAPGYPYLLYVGARKAHKNLPVMLTAFARSGLAGTCKILLSGNPDPGLQALAARLGIADDLRFAGFIPEEHLPTFYRGALALVMVSTIEGFGLPVLEAMASGTPALCSSTTSLGEVGHDAALLVDPVNVDQIAHAMHRIAHETDLRQALIQAGLRRVTDFNWDHSANILASVLTKAAGNS